MPLVLVYTAGYAERCHAADGARREAQRVAYTEAREPCAGFNPLGNLYFGDLHVHTALSHETWILDVRSTPEDAYSFARGAPIRLPPLDERGRGTRTVQLVRPLDFAAVTDHGEFLGEVEACVAPDSGVYDALACRVYRRGGLLSEFVMAYPSAIWKPRRSWWICGWEAGKCSALARRVWRRIRKAAEDAYDRSPACSFTTFVAYEHTGLPGASNLHRNVIFRNATVPDLPISYFEQPTPRGLWADLERTCLDGLAGCDVLAIPHNSNESNGRKFRAEYPGARNIDEQRQAAAQRARVEPLVEVFQHKGDSECMNGLAGVLGEPDDLCDFEKLRRPPFRDCGDGTGFGGLIGHGCVSRLDYVRNALLEGLREEQRLGVNPYKLGMIASTDTHNPTPGAVAEDSYPGHWGKKEDTPGERLGPGGMTHQGVVANPGGLTAVWAVENSRDAIFEAFRRRETYATSGPRIAVRFFGGWDYPETMCDERSFAQLGYARGVPMGADLPPRPQGTSAPRFAVRAARAPDSGGRKGTPLQRIQVIKGWIDGGGRPRHRVIDVAGDRNNGATVDLETCQTGGGGLDSLCTVWTDPDFRADQRAFYYVRVVEDPTCRWSTHECNRLPPDQRPGACSDPEIARVIQERAWTSPIWYRPEARERPNCPSP